MARRSQRRGRRSFRRGSRSSGRRYNSLSSPIVNVRPKNFRHTRIGHGSISVNSRRRITAYPVNPDSSRSWVFDALTWAGRRLMSLLGQSITSSLTDLLDLVPREEFEKVFDPAFPLSQKVTVYQPVGAFCSLALGPEDLLTEHPGLSTFHEDTAGSKLANYIYFESGLIEWLQVSIHPAVALTGREGQVALAVQPISSKFDQIRDFHPRSFHDILSLPKSVCGEASRPLTIVWSPTRRDIGSMWRSLGSMNYTSKDSSKAGFETAAGGEYSVIIYFAYSAHGDGEAGSGHYAPSSATFAIYIDGRVSLRSPTSTAAPCRINVTSFEDTGKYGAGIYGSANGKLTETCTVLDPHGRAIPLLNTQSSSSTSPMQT